MGIYYKDPTSHTWIQANNPTAKLIWVQVGGGTITDEYWGMAQTIWVRDPVDHVWKKTDYVIGVPNAPTNLVITSSATNFTNFSFQWTAPVGGAPVDHYHFRFYHQDGSFWDQTTIPAGTTTLTWPVGTDLYYQMDVCAVSVAGIESPLSNRVRYHIGHPQQTRQDPVYGWGAQFQIDTNYSYVSTTGVSGATTYAGWQAVDGDPNTYWASTTRTDTSAMEGIRVFGPSSYRRVYSVRVQPVNAERFWLGMAQDGTWYPTSGGLAWPTTRSLWISDAAYSYFGVHTYLYASGITTPGVVVEFVIGNQYVFTLDRCAIDIAVDELSTLNGGLRAGIREVALMVQDWTVVRYNTVVTVNQLNNAYF